MARQRPGQTRKTAPEAYHALATEIETLLDALAEALDVHHHAHEARPTDWGFVGDLGHVRDRLADVLAFVGPRRREDRP